MRLNNKLAKNKSLLESFFSLSVLNGLNVLLPLITLPYILRIIGSSNYGIYAYVYALIQYLLLLNTYGFNLSATKQVVESGDKSELNIIYNSVIACRLLLLFGGIALFALLSPFLLDTVIKKWMFLMGLGIVVGDTFNPVWLFQGMEKMRYMTIVNLVSKSLFTVLIFVFIRKADDYPYILLINSLGYLLAGVTSTTIVKKQFGISFFISKWKDIKFQFREGLALFGTSVGTNLYGNANVFILNFFVGESALGIYAAAEKIIKGLQMLTSPITQALFPYIGKNFREKSIEYKLNRIKKLTGTLFFILIIPNIAVFFGADWLVKLFCGPGFEKSVLLLKIMSPAITLGTMNYVLGIIGLVNLNKQKFFFYGVTIAGCVSVLFVLLTASRWETLSASIAVPVSELVLLIICIANIAKIRKSING